MTRLAFPILTRRPSIVLLFLLSTCYSTIKYDEEQNSRDGEIDENEDAFGNYDKSRYTIVGSGGDATATDRVTELVWQLDYQSEMTFQNALDYCSELELGGRRDWRLPNELDLLTIVDINGNNSSSSFPNMSGEWFWTSTEAIVGDEYARFIRFDQGDVMLGNKENAYAVRCVRGVNVVP